jgi:hypothetical protein
MTDKSSDVDSELRQGEIAVPLPPQSDAGVYFIGTIRTPWHTRRECPKRGSLDGPICSIEVDERWREGLTHLTAYKRVQVLYWMHRARRDLVLQTPFSSMVTTGTLCATLASATKSDRFLGRRTGRDRRRDTPGPRARLPRRHPADRSEGGAHRRVRIATREDAATLSPLALPLQPALGSFGTSRGTSVSGFRSWADR